MTKKWYQSKTLKVNAVIILGVIVQVLTDTQLFDADIQAALIAVINVGLRLISSDQLEK